MTRWLPATALRFGWGVIGVAVTLAVVAIPQLRGAPVDVYPEFRQPRVEVQAEALGLSAVEVEQLITVPLEQDLLNGVPWVERITSKSIPGLSSIELVFEEGTDLYRARQVVQERMTQAHALPGVGTPPVMIQPQSSVNRVAMIGMRSTSVSPIDMSVLARWRIKPRLLGIPGVANVSVWGQRDRQLQVEVDPERLNAGGVTLTQLIETTGNALWVSPLSFVEASTPGTGGFVETPSQRIGVQHVSPIITAEALGNVAIEQGGGKRIADVADVVEHHQPLIGDAAVDGQAGLLIIVDKFPEVSVEQVTRDVAAAMRAMQPGLGGIRVDTQVYRPASFVEDAVRSTGLVALVGLLLMVAAIGLLVSWRAAVIAVVTVPISMLAALFVLHVRGTTFTAMTVLGLTAALALVIDDVVGDYERFRHRCRHPRPGDEALSRRRLVVDSLVEGRVPVTYALVAAALLAAPVLLLPGISGAFGRPAVTAYLLALAAGLIVAVTLAPVLAALLGPGPVPGPVHVPARRTGPAAVSDSASDGAVEGAEPVPSVDAGGERSEAGLRARIGASIATAATAARRPIVAIALAVVLLAAAGVGVARSGSGGWLPEHSDRNLLVRLETVPGTSLAEMSRVSALVTAELHAVEGVASVGTTVGRAVTSDRIVDVNSAELWVSLTEGANTGRVTDAVRAIATGYPGVTGQLRSYSADRVDAATPKAAGDLVVRVYGSDYTKLSAAADDVRTTLSSVRGVVSPRVLPVATQPTVRIEVDLERAKRVGLKPGDVRREAATLISGLLVGNLYEEQKVFDVVVWGGPAQRHSPSTLSSLRIDTPSGEQIRLGDVATVSLAPEPVAVAHDAVLRHMDVVASVPGGDRETVAAAVSSRLRALSLPLEYRAEVVDQPTSGMPGARLWWMLGAVLIGILLIFQAGVRTWRTALLVTLLVPLGCAGGLLVAPAVGGVTSASALAGLVAVAALTARHALLLLEAIVERLRLPTAGSARAVTDAVAQQASPVLGSAVAVAALFLPAAVTAGRGLEFLHPAALVVVVGLISSVLVTLVVLPAAYLALGVTGKPDAGVARAALDMDLQDGRPLATAGTTSEGN
jgi:Cu/Ag efflux pump CusA